MKWLLFLLCLTCSSPPRETPAPEKTKEMPPAAVGVGHSGNLWTSNRIPLFGIWTQYFDRDLGLLDAYSDGEVIAAPLVPQEGVIVAPPLNSPTVQEVGIGGRRSIRVVPAAALSQGFSSDPVAALLNGLDKPCSVMMRIQRINFGSVAIAGAARSTSASQDFFELFNSAAGLFGTRKDSATEATVIAAGTTNLQFTDHVLASVTDGVQCWEYVDGVLEPAFPQPLQTLAIVVDRYSWGVQRRNAIQSGLDGLISHMAITDRVLTAAQVAEVSAKWLLGDAPTIPGEFVLPLGDSLTQGSFSTNTNGFRKLLWEHIVANTYNANLVGGKFNGNFPDNEHSGYSGFNLSNLTGVATTQLGPGMPFDATRVVLLLAGTNNMGVGATPFNDPGTMNEYANLLNVIVGFIPTIRMTVTTLPAIDPALYPAPSANVNTFNAALPAIWDAFDAANPLVPLRRWDANVELGGPGFVAANYVVDGVHMNDTGYALLAAALITAADPLLAAL